MHGCGSDGFQVLVLMSVALFRQLCTFFFALGRLKTMHDPFGPVLRYM